MKLPTDEKIIADLNDGLTAKEIAAKYRRTYINIQTRITDIHVKAEKEQHQKNRVRTTLEKTEAEIIADRRWANPRVGDVILSDGMLVHRYTGEEVCL